MGDVVDFNKMYDDLKNSCIGSRIRSRRMEMGFSLSELAHRLGVSVSELKEYEQGSRDIHCDTLFWVSQILQTDVNYFFEDIYRLSVYQ